MKNAVRKMSRALGVFAIVVAYSLSLVGCGAIKMSDVAGDWTTDTIDGKAEADFSADKGMPAGAYAVNVKVAEEKATITNSAGEVTELTVEAKSNGFETKKDGEVFQSFVYEDGKLSAKMDLGNGTHDVVFKKGTTDFSALEAATEE